MLRRLAPALSLALLVPLAGTATAVEPDPYEAARSTPVEDSYYPAKGDPGIDALHYDLDLAWDKRKRTLRGDATVTLRATGDADRLQLDLARSMRVSSVRVDGFRARFAQRRTTLVVEHPVTAEHRFEVQVAYAGTPGPVAGPSSRPDVAKVGMRVTRDGQLWTMQEPWGALTWYPVNDQPSDKALYDVTVRTPGRWAGISNGELLSSSYRNKRTVSVWRNRYPTASYLVTLAVGPYTQYTRTGPHRLPLQYWVPRSQPKLVKPMLRTAAAIGWLEKRLGRYPYDRLSVVVTPSGSAMETQTMITFGQKLYRYGPDYVRSVMVHELAHHWYGDTVTPTHWRDLWMSEGMATYLENQWRVDQGWHSWRRYTRWVASNDQDWRNRWGAPGSYDPAEFAQSNVYHSVALMWDALRRKLGAGTFDRLVREWPQQHRDSNQDRASLVAWFEEQSGQRLGGFFRRWLDARRSPA